MNNKLLKEIEQFAEEIIEIINKMGLTGDDIEPITRILSVATSLKMIEQNNLMLEQHKQMVKMVNPWISIKDRLPELNTNVLVRNASDSKYRLLSYHYSFDSNLIWQNEEGRFDYIDENDMWMPIPECKE